MVEIEFTKRVPVNGFFLLPGTRAEFATAGQAGYFTARGVAKVVNKPTKRKGAANAGSRKRATAAAGDSGGSEDESSPRPE